MGRQVINIRKAIIVDVPDIVRLLADDMLGSMREQYSDPLPECYYDAFDAINNDNKQMLAVAEIKRKTVGTLQISYLPNMSFQGAMRAIVEGVHVDSNYRNQGIGQAMIEWAIAEAKKKGCRFVQLTSNKQRNDAHRFYERLGFAASHEGFKLDLWDII